MTTTAQPIHSNDAAKPTQRAWLDAQGIVHWQTSSPRAMDLEDAKEAIAMIGAAAAGSPRPVLIDMLDIVSMSRQARQYFAGAETAKIESAAALLIRSPLNKAIGNFFLGLNKPLMPTKLFTSESEAMKWLTEFAT